MGWEARSASRYPAQLPAVRRTDIFGTMLWRQFSVLLLREVKRAVDPALASTLAKVRMGICDEEVLSGSWKLGQH